MYIFLLYIYLLYIFVPLYVYLFCIYTLSVYISLLMFILLYFVKTFLLYIYIRLGELMALEIATIHFLDQEWKVESSFGFDSNDFFDDLLLDALWATILIGLGMHGKL